jgi:hypothetical protein
LNSCFWLFTMKDFDWLPESPFDSVSRRLAITFSIISLMALTLVTAIREFNVRCHLRLILVKCLWDTEIQREKIHTKYLQYVQSLYLDRDRVNTTKVKFATMYMCYWSYLQLCTCAGKKWWRQSPYSGKVVSPKHRPSLPPGNISGTHFCSRLGLPKGHSAAERIMSIKNSDTIGNRSRDLPVCSAVPQMYECRYIYRKQLPKPLRRL